MVSESTEGKALREGTKSRDHGLRDEQQHMEVTGMLRSGLEEAALVS